MLALNYISRSIDACSKLYLRVVIEDVTSHIRKTIKLIFQKTDTKCC